MRRIAPALVLVLTACAATPPAASNTNAGAVRRQLDSLDGAFNRWLAERQLDSIASQYYWPDAVAMNQGSPPAQGADAIRAGYNQLFSMGRVKGHIAATSLVVGDSVASDMGRYEFEIRSATDSTKVLVSDHGSYVTTFVRRNGQWRALYDINTSEVPPPPPSPAPSADSRKK